MTDPAVERPGWLDTLTDSLSEQSRLNQVVALRPGIGARPAAVLILIGAGPRGPEIMFVAAAELVRTKSVPRVCVTTPDRLPFLVALQMLMITIWPTLLCGKRPRRPALTGAASKSSAYFRRRTWRSAGSMSQR